MIDSGALTDCGCHRGSLPYCVLGQLIGGAEMMASKRMVLAPQPVQGGERGSWAGGGARPKSEAPETRSRWICGTDLREARRGDLIERGGSRGAG